MAYDDRIIFVSAEEEPKTSQVDTLVEDIILKHKERPSGIIGIGGGTLLDLAKAVSIMLTNNGETKDYQGWDLVKNPAVFHVGIPTISGTGAEVSRTTVLTGPFSESYGNMALDLCKEIFLEGNLSEIEAQEKLIMASWHGGMSIAYSQVGIAHAMSYGLSYLLGTKHGIGNCIVFDHLEAFYPEGVKLFKQMKAKHNITLPQAICADLGDREFDIMIDVALSLEPLWENAIGKNWKKTITREKLRTLYQNM